MAPLREQTFAVLVVEDQQRYRDLLVREIGEMGYAAEGVGSAEDAWERLQDKQFSAVLLDLNLPRVGGMELFEKLRASDHSAAVVILTAYAALDSAVAALRLKADDYLTKPCSLADIDQALARIHARWISSRKSPKVASHPVASVPTTRPSEAASPLPPLTQVERAHILKVLAANNGNKRAAARQLGISLRTLYYRLEEYKHNQPQSQ